MSEDGEWTLEGDRCTYNGPCYLELELTSSGSTMRLLSHHTTLEASFDLPGRRPTPMVSYSQTLGPPSPVDSANEEMEDYESEDDHCVELVDILDSIEVIHLLSDSEEEEDPSEGSSSVNAGGSD
ncbi:unnamed protein product [Lupinus luteus]|uniref:Uncharacterized protein n=1 Tax=Lupinus luteus TaxID=3873 RepID=A0AAV1YB90_LUPLU